LIDRAFSFPICPQEGGSSLSNLIEKAKEEYKLSKSKLVATWTTTNGQLVVCNNILNSFGQVLKDFGEDLERSVDLMYKQVV